MNVAGKAIPDAPCAFRESLGCSAVILIEHCKAGCASFDGQALSD